MNQNIHKYEKIKINNNHSISFYINNTTKNQSNYNLIILIIHNKRIHNIQ